LGAFGRSKFKIHNNFQKRQKKKHKNYEKTAKWILVFGVALKLMTVDI